MASSAAQDEFNALVSEKSTPTKHPDDEARESSPESNHSEPERKSQREGQKNADSSDEEMAVTTSNSNSSMKSRYFVPSLRFDANTGPKGVIADAQAFERAKQEHGRLAAVAHRFTKKFTLAQSSVPHAYNTEEYRDRSSGEDEDDDGFMARWRKKRLMELQGKTEMRQSRNTSPSQRQYGSLTTVNAEGYLDAIERVQRDTVVVVYIYDDTVSLHFFFFQHVKSESVHADHFKQSEVSIVVEECVRELARAHSRTRFVRLHYEEAEMEVAGVPAILAYKGGEKFAGLVPIMEELPEEAELSAETLGTLLKE